VSGEWTSSPQSSRARARLGLAMLSAWWSIEDEGEFGFAVAEVLAAARV
jgi:hypothetical protein